MPESALRNPLAPGMGRGQFAQPCTLVIFGGGGDLTRRKLLPALYNLALDGVLPTNFAVLGFALNEMDDQSYRAFARSGVEEFSRRAIDEGLWHDFERSLFYLPGSFDDPASFEALKKKLEEIEPKFGIPCNRVYYLAIPPAVIGLCVERLDAAGLAHRDGEG